MNKLLIKLFSLVITLTLLSIGPISCIGTRTTTAEAESSSNQSVMNVNIKLFTFKPKALEVPVGTTVVWANGDAVNHSVTNGTPDKPEAAFDSGLFNLGKTFSFTFTKPGEYNYHCKKHDFMRGTVKVIPARD